MKKRTLIDSENKMPRTIFGLKKEEVTEGCTKYIRVHNL
jgi:hypothetical protein